MPPPRGSLHRAIAGVTVGAVQSMRARDQRDRQMGLSELMQQFELVFSGTAGSAWGFAQTTVTFEFPFYYAPGQRDPQFENPHYWFGAETSAPVAVSVTVKQWTLDEDHGSVVGAVLYVGVCGVGQTPYNGVAHLTFQGFSALAEDEVGIE